MLHVVAQISNLLYRRIAFCWAVASLSALEHSHGLPIENLRYFVGSVTGLRTTAAIKAWQRVECFLPCAP